jgi:hypothetical protein
MTEKKKPMGDHDVGYAKPPKEHQFREGQSGNPKGRTPGSRNLRTELREELGELIKLRENGKTSRITKQRAIIKSLVTRAIKGNDRAAVKVIDLQLRLSGIEMDASDAGLPLTKDESAIMKSLRERVLRQDVRSAGDENQKASGDDSDCGGGGDTS